MRVVETECARLKLAHADVAVDTRELLGEQQFILVHNIHQNHAARHLQRRLNRVGEARLVGAAAHDQPVHHYLYVVPLLLVKIERLREIAHIAVHAHAHETRLARAFKDLFMLTLAAANHRRHYLDAAAFGQRKHGVDYLLHGLALDRPAALVAVGMPHPREQQPQVVVDLGYRPHGGARVVRNAFLVNGYGGRQPLNVVHIRLVHAPQELAGVG